MAEEAEPDGPSLLPETQVDDKGLGEDRDRGKPGDETSRTPVWSVMGEGLGDRERELSGGPGFQLGGRAGGRALPCV